MRSAKRLSKGERVGEREIGAIGVGGVQVIGVLEGSPERLAGPVPRHFLVF